MSRKRVKAITAAVLLAIGAWLIWFNWPGDPYREFRAQRAAQERRERAAMPPSTAHTVQETKEETQRPDRERREAYLESEEQQLAKTLASGKRMTSLPGFVHRVYVDPSGQAWFVSSGIGDDEAASRRGIEQAWAGTRHIVRAKLWLVDSRRRFWVSFGEPPPRSILCYDGRSWTEHHILPDGRNHTVDIYPHAWEDSAGVVWFVILDRTSKLCWVNRCDPVGHWIHTIVPNEVRREIGAFWEEPQLVESPSGTTAFYSPRVYVADVAAASVLPRIYRYSDDGWKPSLARVCWDHPIDYVMPLADGRVFTICADRRLFLYQPPPEEDLARLMSDLDDPDPSVRDAAISALDSLEPEHIGAVRRGMASAATPAGQLALQGLLRRLLEQQTRDREPRGGPHPGTSSCDGFSFSAVRYVGTNPYGCFLLDVDDYRDPRSPKVIRRALVTYDPKGTRSVQPLPRDWPSDQFGSNTLRDDILLARDGSIWMRDGRRYKDGVITQELPEWLGRMTKQDDNEGRIYFDRSMVVNTNVPVGSTLDAPHFATMPQLPRKTETK